MSGPQPREGFSDLLVITRVSNCSDDAEQTVVYNSETDGNPQDFLEQPLVTPLLPIPLTTPDTPRHNCAGVLPSSRELAARHCWQSSSGSLSRSVFTGQACRFPCAPRYRLEGTKALPAGCCRVDG